VFTRGAPAEEAKGDAPLGGMTLFSLLDAFNRVLKRANAEFSREITAERITIQDRIQEILDLLKTKSASSSRSCSRASSPPTTWS
jgi:chromatin segregation and condensation protein Rec8/ScpA/Scc1 (kleisin family)